jgi:hypothetical protein
MTNTQSTAKSSAGNKSKVAKKEQKPKREVQVVSCPTGFPPFATDASKKQREEEDNKYNLMRETRKEAKSLKRSQLDWHDTAKEIRSLGATGFSGKQKRDYEAEQYLQLTGRIKKKQKIPLPIVRGIKKAADKRDTRQRKEAKEAGIVIPKAAKGSKKSSTTIKNYGPAPSIGFMKKGTFQVKPKRK